MVLGGFWSARLCPGAMVAETDAPEFQALLSSCAGLPPTAQAMIIISQHLDSFRVLGMHVPGYQRWLVRDDRVHVPVSRAGKTKTSPEELFEMSQPRDHGSQRQNLFALLEGASFGKVFSHRSCQQSAPPQHAKILMKHHKSYQHLVWMPAGLVADVTD